MHWSDSLSTCIWIFSVGRGNAAFVRTGLNHGFIVDMGAANGFNPAGFVAQHFARHLDPYKNSRIAQAILSHPHSDHITQCGQLEDGVLYPSLLTCPNEKEYDDDRGNQEKLNWKRVVNPRGTEELTEAYKSLYAKRSLPLQTIGFESNRTVPNLEYGIFYIRPPVCEKIHESDDNKYGNATSIFLYLRHGDHTVLFPGDMTPQGMKHILADRFGTEKRYTVFDRRMCNAHPRWHLETSDQPSLRDLLQERGLYVLIAPHHGLESCFSPDLYETIRTGKPSVVVISERRHNSDRDGAVDARYQSEAGAHGIWVDVEGRSEWRRSISTIKEHHILIRFSGNGRLQIWAHSEAEKLIGQMS